MLKRDSNGRFLYREAGFFKKKRLWRFCSGKKSTQGEMDNETYYSLLAYQQHTPVVVMTDVSSQRWWMFRGDFYREDEGYSETEVKALVLDRIEQKEKRVQRAIARISQNNSESSATRQPIPDDVKMAFSKGLAFQMPIKTYICLLCLPFCLPFCLPLSLII